MQLDVCEGSVDSVRGCGLPERPTEIEKELLMRNERESKIIGSLKWNIVLKSLGENPVRRCNANS